MFTPEERTRTMDGVVTWTYIICVLLLAVVGGLVGGVCGLVFTAKATGGALIGAIVGGLLGYWAAWWQNFWVYTTFIRVDEMLLEMRDMRKCQEDKLGKSLLDIKNVLETIASSLATQSALLESGGKQLSAQDGASPDLTSENTGDTSAQPSDGKIADNKKVLIASKRDLNARDEDGMTSLMRAIVDTESLASIKALIAAGSDVNARDSYGKTALMWAASQSTDASVVKALIDAGADVEARDNIWKSAIQYLEARRDYDTFCATAAYETMRKLLY